MRIQFRPEGGTGCEYYRCELPAQALRLAGHDVKLERPIKVVRGQEIHRALSDRHVVVWQRPMTDEDLASIEIDAPYVKVVDLDDDLFSLPSWNPMLEDMQRRNDFTWLNNLKTCIRTADLVTVSTEELAAVVRPFNENVTVLQNHVDLPAWKLARMEGAKLAQADHDAGRLRVGWAGWRHHGDLDVLYGTIEPVLREYNAKLVLIGWLDARQGFQYDDSMIELIDWTPISEYKKYVASLDVGLAPLADSRFNGCKSHVKVLEYMAAGVIPIASKHHPEYSRLISDGENGMLAGRAKHWSRRLRSVLADDMLRARMLDAGSKTVQGFGLQRAGERWQGAYAEACTTDDRVREVRGVGFDAPRRMSVVIPVCGQLDFLKRCVAAVERTVKHRELIIVDNASDKATARYCDQVADVYIRNDENLGFARAANQGMLQATGDLYVILNSDTVPASGWSRALLRAFAEEPNLGVANPTTNYARGAACLWNIHGADFDRVAAGEMIDVTDEEVERIARLVCRDTVQATEDLSGFCLVIRPQLVEQIGGFDTSFGLGGGEDRDFIRRARQRGWSAAWVRGAYVHHLGHRSMLDIFDDHQSAMTDAEREYELKHARLDGQLAPYVPLVETDRLPVLMLTWNRLEYTKQALAALSDNSERAIQVVVIDDGSDDGTRDWLRGIDRKRYQVVATILNPERRGVDVNQDTFCRRVRGCERMAKVDNDTVVPVAWDTKLLRAMREKRLSVIGADHHVGVGIPECEGDREIYFDRSKSKPVVGGRVYYYQHVGGSGVIWTGDMVERMYAAGITIADAERSITLDRWTDFQHAAVAMFTDEIAFFDGVFVRLLDMEGDNARKGDFPEYEELMIRERRSAMGTA